MRFCFAMESVILLIFVIYSADVNANFNPSHTAVVNTEDMLSSGSGFKHKKITSTENDNLRNGFKRNLSLTWNADDSELYIPINAWHNRLTYSSEKLRSYNEISWGIGYGKYRFDTQNNWHSVYAMGFMDSHNKFEPIVGYGYQKIWTPGDIDRWRFGAGFTLSVTARHEYNYIPIPILLPLLSIEYNRLSLQTTYIPGTRNNGNVLFTWVRWQL